MGVGKTTIGRLLADRLRLGFVDTDREIEQRSGADIPWIFDVEGEEGFRARESVVLQDLLDSDGQVIATGGGIVLKEANRTALHRGATVIYLKAGVERLLERTSRDKRRPLLQVDDPESKIRELIEFRHPLYEAVSHQIFSAEGNRPRQLVGKIARYCESELADASKG